MHFAQQTCKLIQMFATYFRETSSVGAGLRPFRRSASYTYRTPFSRALGCESIPTNVAHRYNGISQKHVFVMKNRAAQDNMMSYMLTMRLSRTAFASSSSGNTPLYHLSSDFFWQQADSNGLWSFQRHMHPRLEWNRPPSCIPPSHALCQHFLSSRGGSCGFRALL